MLVTPGSFSNGLTSPFAKLWRGQYSLPPFITGTFLASIIAMVVYTPFYFAGMPQTRQPLAVIAMIVYPIFAAVGVWRPPFSAMGCRCGSGKDRCLFLVAQNLIVGIASRVTGMGFMDVVRLAGYHL
jgi:hypothetical protein